MAYLQQISAENRPASSGNSLGDLFSGKAFKIAGIFTVVALVIIIALSIISAAMPKPVTAESDLSRIYLRSNTLLDTIKTYNSSVKSSELRAAGASLSAVLTDLSSSTSSTLETSYDIKASDLSLPSVDAVALEKSATALSSAKLNGILDRSYASELSYQISYLILLEDSALSKSLDSTAADYLSTSRSSLITLQASFSNFSETK